MNVDVRGNLTKCCHLSGHGEAGGDGDVMGDLTEESFAEAYDRLVRDNERFMSEKRAMMARGDMVDTDLFPCWFCSVSYGKVEWLRKIKSGPWSAQAGSSRLKRTGQPPVEVSENGQPQWIEVKL